MNSRFARVLGPVLAIRPPSPAPTRPTPRSCELERGLGAGRRRRRSRRSGPDLARGRRVELLAALIKADLRCRFEPRRAPRRRRLPRRVRLLRRRRDRVVSLVYEEYCLREEARRGAPTPRRSAAGTTPGATRSCRSSAITGCSARPSARSPPRRPACRRPGERFRSFRLGSMLGQGGTARVFLANDESLGDRVVALKVSTDRGKEPAIQGRLDHAHIVPVLSVTDDPETGLRGLCMPYRAGLPLDEVIRLVDPASRPRQAAVLREVARRRRSRARGRIEPRGTGWQGFPQTGTVCRGGRLGRLGRGPRPGLRPRPGVYHRDIKPANVLLTARDGPQLLDFNLAHSPHTADQAEAALRGGTLPYMAPEQLEAFLDPERWDDVGEVGRHLLARPPAPRAADRPPARGARRRPSPLPRAIRDLLDRRVTRAGSARTLNPDVPHGLDAILARCLAYRPRGPLQQRRCWPRTSAGTSGGSL